MNYKWLCLSLVYCLASLALAAGPVQDSSCKASLANGVLVLENDCIAYTYNWNSGQLTGKTIDDKKTGYGWELSGNTPDCYLPGASKPVNASLTRRWLPATTVTPAHLEATVITSYGQLMLKRVFRIYPGCPALACDLYLKGSSALSWKTTAEKLGDLKNIENKQALEENKKLTPTLTRIGIPGKHWRVRAVQFFDVTDRVNNLVQETDQLLYRGESKLAGNLLFADELLSDHGIFLLKEAPASTAQLAWPGFDFLTRIGEIQVAGLGIAAEELTEKDWTKCYGFVTGVTSGGLSGRLNALRSYQEKVRIHLPKRDDMILMNTWGDRSQDKSLGEAFTLRELKAAHRLGITHYQLDDGWQAGRSANSAFAGGSFVNIWNNPGYWLPHPEKFPNGLKPVMELARELGIEICLWFNPSKDSSYANWRKDAGALIRLYREYGIRTFKIDGVQVADKQAEINLRRMFDTLMQVTKQQAVFNLDVTAGIRYGYHYFNEYGNIFLENRYTDWGNYYPHWTLRNLWMLSKYVPAQNLQIEFLNNFRNADKYPADDPLAPSKRSFDYLFALTMMAQPLAWMEATGLPEKAFELGPVIKKYQSLQTDLHAGRIFPVGEEPDGFSWTGFQSVNGDKGYLLVIREQHGEQDHLIKTWLPAGKKILLEQVLGAGETQTVTTGTDGAIRFSLPAANSYALYKYRVLDTAATVSQAVHYGFETPLSNSWRYTGIDPAKWSVYTRTGELDQKRCAGSAVINGITIARLTHDLSRAGSSAGQCILDQSNGGVCHKAMFRNTLFAPGETADGAEKERWLAFSLYLPGKGPDEWVTDRLPELLFQVHNDTIAAPQLSLNCQDDNWSVNYRFSEKDPHAGKNAGMQRRSAWQGKLVKGRWTDWVWHFRFSSAGREGLLEVWLNEGKGYAKIVDLHNLRIGYPCRQMTTADIGIYKWPWKCPPGANGDGQVKRRVLYVDEIRLAGAAAAFDELSIPAAMIVKHN